MAAAALLAAGCAGPIEILKQSRISERRLEAIEQLRTDEYEGRVEALASVLGDEDEGVAKAAAEALASLGKEGRERLQRAFEDPLSQCAAASVLAREAGKDAAIVAMLDPTGQRIHKGNSCLVKQFLGFGDKTHPMILDALTAEEPWRVQRGVFLACRAKPTVLTSLDAILTGKAKPEEVRRGVKALRVLLEARPRHCSAEVDGLWGKLFADSGLRSRAMAAATDHPRRDDLLRGLLGRAEGCAGPDAMVTLVEEGAEPTDQELEAFRGQVEASDGDCPSVDAEPLVDHLLTRGWAGGTPPQQALLEALGWEADDEGAAAHTAVVAGDYEAAAQQPQGAHEILDRLVRIGLSDESRTNALLALTHVGKRAVPEIELAYGAVESEALRFDLLKTVRDLDGPRSLALVRLVVRELDSGPAPDRSQELTAMLKAAGPVAVAPLGREALAARDAGMRARLFALQVELGGKGSKVVLGTAERLVARGGSDPATVAAAQLLVESDPAGQRGRILDKAQAGELKEADVALLGILLEKDPATYAALAKPVKSTKDPERLLALAGPLGEAGVADLAFACADRAGASYAKAAKKAKKQKDDGAREAAEAGAEKAAALRVSLAGEMALVVADETAGPAVRLRTLKALTKAAKTAGKAKSDVLERLGKAEASDKNLKKALAKAVAKWKKAK